MSGAVLGQEILSCMSEQAEKAVRSKPVSKTPVWLLLQFLS